MAKSEKNEVHTANLSDEIQAEIDNHYNYIENFVYDYCKDNDDRKEFFEHLSELISCEIEAEKECGV